ncbi:Acyl- sterol acyltransferase [Fusarium acutatum]|uniref:Acyl- sterol acyltransferase n=1 Tax=Fusarium acutatum TaxID=78861 RepID=A0A8H4NI47_9HYPO|nr:Acyl- sterol acyltransferase [Fusarium acutatum]
MAEPTHIEMHPRTSMDDDDPGVDHNEQESLLGQVISSRMGISASRFANALEFSKFIPELNPDNERAQTFRTRTAKRGTMLKLQMSAALLVDVIMSAFLLWSILSYPPNENGVGTFIFDSCDTIRDINAAAHVLINIISSLFLGAGNYCMQILIAPSREEINAAQAKGRALDIGVPSIKNILSIERKRVTLWLFIGIISTTLHIFWNSTVFTSLPIVAVPRVVVTSDFRSSSDNWTTSEYLTNAPWWTPPSDEDQAAMSIESLYSLQSQATGFTRLDTRSCIKSFINPLEATRSVIVVSSNMTTMKNNGSSLIDGYVSGWEEWWAWSSGWICSAYQINTYDLRYCTWDWAESFADNWTIMAHGPVRVDYCLVSDGVSNKERCGLHYSKHILAIVCVCIFLDTLAIAWTWIHSRRGSRTRDSKKSKRTMVTIGDAIHSFLETPLDGQRSLQLNSDEIGGIKVCRKEWLTERRIKWFRAVSTRTCVVSFSLFAIGMALCIYPVVSSYTFLLGRGFDSKSLWGQGFGVNPAMTSNDMGPLTQNLTRTKTRAMLSNIIVANLPQALFSLLYLFYNNILTRQLVADEWVRFLQPGEKKVLRVSSPRVFRTSYDLLHHGPLASITEHVSRSNERVWAREAWPAYTTLRRFDEGIHGPWVDIGNRFVPDLNLAAGG